MSNLALVYERALPASDYWGRTGVTRCAEALVYERAFPAIDYWGRTGVTIEES